MQAVILAGGKGTRLKPYTVCLPKPLVPIGEQPILEIIIRQLVYYGFDKVTISTGHLAGLIEAYFGNGDKWGVHIEYVREYTPLNTAGALQLLDACEDNILVMNGDVLTTIDYRNLMDIHRKQGAQATIAVKQRDAKIDFGVINVDDDGFLSAYIEKPTYHFLVSMGVYVLSKEALQLIKKDEAIGMPDLLLRIKSNNNRVYCFESDSYWLDIGRVDDYEEAQRHFETYKAMFLR